MNQPTLPTTPHENARENNCFRALARGLIAATILLLSLISAGDAQAATLTSRSGACGAIAVDTSTSYASTTAGPAVCDAQGSTASASGFAGPGVLGGFVESNKVCCGLPLGSTTISALQTEFFISGPPGNIPVGLELDLTSVLSDLNLNASTNYVVLTIEVQIDDLNGYRHGTITSDGRSNISGLSSFGFGAYNITVAPVLISTGFTHVLDIIMRLDAAGFNAFQLGTDHVALDALHTLTFNQGGGVFTLPSGNYQVNDIPEM